MFEEIGANLSLTTDAVVPQGGEGHHRDENRADNALSATISAIVELQKQRVFCIKSQSRCDRSCEAFITRYLGYRNDLTEKERKALFTKAASYRKKIEKGGQRSRDSHIVAAPEADGGSHEQLGNQWDSDLSVCDPIILNSAAARSAWDAHRNQVEKRMRKLSGDLPISAWAAEVAGFGPLGLAIVVGETGDIGSYATKERVWKRLGLAVIEGIRQQKRTNAEDAAKHGYNPRRRAEIWTIADSMFKHQWRGAKDDEPAGPRGRYGAIYMVRKAHTENREWSLAHRDTDARRIMMKALIEDLWSEWRGAS